MDRGLEIDWEAIAKQRLIAYERAHSITLRALFAVFVFGLAIGGSIAIGLTHEPTKKTTIEGLSIIGIAIFSVWLTLVFCRFLRTGCER